MKKKNTVMIIDAGGRGAALVDAYAKSSYVGRILAVPGNDLMRINTDKEAVTYQYLKTTSVKEILKIVQQEKVDLVDVAQDNAIAVGLVDELQKEGITAFGPSQKAGQIEWDKAWARDFGVRHNLPQPIFQSFSSVEEGVAFIKSQREEKKWFIKASGLAEGKGVLPAISNEEAVEKIRELNENFKNAAETYLVEEWLEGEEFSTFALCDGENFQIVGSAQDHKRVYDGDNGPNTGGMGCSTPPLILTEEIIKQVYDIFVKTITGLKKEGRPYAGVLYLGGMIVNGDPYVIEFNARWGDPEAQVILPGLMNDLFEVGVAVAQTNISKIDFQTDGKARVVVAATTRGYPGEYPRGKEIFGLNEILKLGVVKIYGAGVKKRDGRYFTNGGRVFYIVSEGRDVIEARGKAYEAMKLISIEDDGLHFRTDIGYRDVARLHK